MEHGKGAEVRRKGGYGTYNVGVKDLASACVLCPRLAERGGLSIYGRDKGLRNNEGIRKSRVVTQARRLSIKVGRRSGYRRLSLITS